VKREHLPDPGADITVYLRSGQTFTGAIAAGHVFAPADETLCLAVPASGRLDPNWLEDSAEHLWQYVRLDEIVAWTWDCRP
jgi:hypothetical protein